MSTVFDMPCPECGHQMSVRPDGDAECVGCERRYHSRMGHLFPSARLPECRLADQQESTRAVGS